MDPKSLLPLVYDAAADSCLWPVFLDALTEATRAGQTAFMHWDRADVSHLSVIVRADPAWVRDYETHYAACNPWMLESTDKWAPGVVLPGEALVPQARFQQSEFYNDYLRRIDIAHALGACVMGEPPRYSNLTVLRPSRRGPFDHAELELLRALVPHISQALALHRRLDGARTLAMAATVALEHTAATVFLVNATGRVVFATDKAHRLAGRNDGLHLVGGELRTHSVSETQALRNLIRRAAETTTGDGYSAGGTLRVTRRNGEGNPYAVTVSPLPGGVSTHLAAAAVLVAEPIDATHHSADAWRLLFDLTAAERAVASRMVTGADPSTMANDLGLAVSTVRTHIKRMQRKTGTRRHAELLSALRRTMPQVKSDVE